MGTARGGIHVYAAWGPAPVQVFVIGLVILDPLIFVLLAVARPAGVWLACITVISVSLRYGLRQTET